MRKASAGGSPGSSPGDYSVRRLVRKREWVPGPWVEKYTRVKGCGFVPTGERQQQPGWYELEPTGALGEEIARFKHERDALYFARKRGSAYDAPELVVLHNGRIIGTKYGKGTGLPVTIAGDAMELSPVPELLPPGDDLRGKQSPGAAPTTPGATGGQSARSGLPG